MFLSFHATVHSFLFKSFPHNSAATTVPVKKLDSFGSFEINASAPVLFFFDPLSYSRLIFLNLSLLALSIYCFQFNAVIIFCICVVCISM